MAVVPASSAGSFVELEVGNSVESLGRLLDGQKELFHSQIDQLQKLVVAQCKLTGVNPLSQEMAAGALSIKIGKKPRDLLNPKAVKYMQSLFSIKDLVGKKESREISALCGITITQVKEYFAGQRSRVRKLVRLSRDKAIRLNASKAARDGLPVASEQSLLASKEAPANTFDSPVVGESIQAPGNSGVPIAVQAGQQEPAKADLMVVVFPMTLHDGQQNPVKIDPKTVEEAPSCSSQEETIPGIDSDDKKFLENIFNLMRKEETFSGQVKLMEWVLQIHNSAVLIWFLTKGGLTILATWLSQAAVEEQTSVLLVIFKVLCHLPLHKSQPEQMSAVLQAVNRLRFYRTSDISNRAKILLSRWSKMFVRSQSLKNSSSINSSKNGRKEIVQKQRICEILGDESWQSNVDIPEEILALAENTEDNWRSERRKVLRLLPESSDGSTKKHGRSVSSSKIKERRKVLLVEQPECKTAGRSVQVARAVPSNHSRPLSADDIQKAKMRAVFMQNKYGKAEASTSGSNQQKTEDNKLSSPLPQASSTLPSNTILPQISQLKRDEVRKPPMSMTNTPPHKVETTIKQKPNPVSKEQLWEKLKRDQLQWQTPPEMRINSVWRVGVGENSKEVGIQAQRLRRERETFYSNPQDIPPNPKEPWDIEMDFDDSLTPEIPIEQPPDADASPVVAEESLPPPHSNQDDVEPLPATTSAPPPPITNNGVPEPDLELLAVLLKNPELVFALTSDQGKSLSSDQTVALLDTLKQSGVGLTGITNRMVDSSNEKPKEPEPTSLPSPTPPSDHTRAGWRSEFPTHSKTPLLQPHFSGSSGVAALPAITIQTPSAVPQTPSAAIPLGVPPQVPNTILSTPQLTVTVNPSPQHIPANNFVPNKSQAPFPHQRPPPTHHPLHHAGSHEAITSTIPPMPGLFTTPSRVQSPLVTEVPQAFQTRVPSWPPAAIASTGRQEVMPESWAGRLSGSLGVPMHNPGLPINQGNYNSMHPNGPMQQLSGHRGFTGDRSEILDGELETWSPGNSPIRSPQFRSGHNFSEPRREFGWSQGAEWSRQWDSGHRDHYRRGGGGRRRRDRDRDRDRRR